MKMVTYNPEEKNLRSGNLRFRDQLRIMARPELGFIKGILINTLAMSLLGLAIPIAVQSVINNIGVRTMLQPVVILSLILLFVVTFGGFLQVIQTYTVEILRRRLFIRYGVMVMERLCRYLNERYDQINSQALINRYFDVVIMQSAMVNFFVEGAAFIIMYLISFTLLAFYHPYFLIFAFFMTIFLIANWVMFGIDGIKAGSPEANGKYAVEAWLEEIARTRSMFQSKCGRKFSNDKMATLIHEWIGVRNNLFTCQFKQHIGLQIFSILTNVMLVFLGSMLVLKGQLSIGQLVAAALVLSNIVSNVPRLQAFFISIYDYSTSLDKIAEFYDYPLELENSELMPDKYDIRFCHATYKPNFDFDFTIKEGTKNYIYIKSFSAKHKVIDALLSLHPVEKGELFIGDKLINDLDVAGLRDQFHLIRSDYFFEGTLLENLIGFIPKAKTPGLTEIHDALKKVGMMEMVESLPDGLQTQIRPHGYPFTSSQLLSLQVARILIAKPKVVIATSDFELISTFKRNLCLAELTNKEAPWTLLFFSQKIQKDLFENYTGLSRNKLIAYNSRKDLLQELESDAK